MELWIAITIGAAFLQNIRSTLQKHLKGSMGTTGATFVRFGFGLPFAILFVAGLAAAGKPVPGPSLVFLGWVIVASLSQILAQALLVHLFAYRNFAVGTAYSRTEPAQTALFGLVLLGENIRIGAVFAILISVAGVMAISVARTTVSLSTLLTSLVSRTALIGLASGTAFGVAAVAYRAASLSLADQLETPDFLMQAAVVLLWAICLQTFLMAAWMALKDREEIVRIQKAWKISALVGLVGATASFGWFAAMTLQNAAVVKALAQIEILFTFASTIFFFKEHINRLEIIGCFLITAGILVLIVSS